MKKVREIPSSDVAAAADERAAHWFGRSRAGMTDREEAEFAGWIETSGANREAYTQVEGAWNFLGAMASDPRVAEMRGEALWMKPRRRLSFASRSLAASLLLGLAVALGFHALGPVGGGPGRQVAAADSILLQTAIGERSTARLRDGSIVTLNTNSRVRVAYDARNRSVTLLSGQAFFKVAKDETRPFVVAAGDRRVIAVGTEFDVALQDRGIRVALLEGRVHVVPVLPAKSSDKGAALRPGQLLFADRGTGKVTVRPADMPGLLSWREGRVRFDETPLADAVAEMNRYTQTPITIADPAIGKFRISGSFRAGQSRSFVASLAGVFPVRAVATPSSVELHAAR